MPWESVGRVGVGSESLTDRSKSVKSSLMRLAEAHGCRDAEGVDTVNACYGGTAALLSGADWLQSAAWDGRWAAAVCSDIAEPAEPFTFLCGAAAVGVLLGPEAGAELQRERASCVVDRWDFWKPAFWKDAHAHVEGEHSKHV